MNMLVPNFVANQKSGFEIMYSLMAKGLDGFEKLITLNSQAVNSMLVETQEAVVKALAAKDPKELFALQTSQTRSAADRAQSYWRQVYETVSTRSRRIRRSHRSEFQAVAARRTGVRRRPREERADRK
jgi:phasin family protein